MRTITKGVLAVIAGALFLLLTPVATQAQQASRPYRIGVVSPIASDSMIEAFRQGLREVGYVEGKNVIVETRFADGHLDRLPRLVNEVLAQKVDVLVVGSTVGALAAKRATATVPIVFAGLTDPVSAGVIASLARPGGNITGVTFGVGASGFAGKWVQLLHELAPGVSRVAVLTNPASPLMVQLIGDIQKAAYTLGIGVDVVEAGNAKQLEQALTSIESKATAQALIVPSDPFFVASARTITDFAARRRLPGVYFTGLFADAGGLMSYGSSLEESYRRAATPVDKILRGATPAEIPVEQPTTFQLVINMRAARALGLPVPRSLLQRADRVIE